MSEPLVRCPHAKVDEPCWMMQHPASTFTDRNEVLRCRGCQRSITLLTIEKRKLRRGGMESC